MTLPIITNSFLNISDVRHKPTLTDSDKIFWLAGIISIIWTLVSGTFLLGLFSHRVWFYRRMRRQSLAWYQINDDGDDAKLRHGFFCNCTCGFAVAPRLGDDHDCVGGMENGYYDAPTKEKETTYAPYEDDVVVEEELDLDDDEYSFDGDDSEASTKGSGSKGRFVYTPTGFTFYPDHAIPVDVQGDVYQEAKNHFIDEAVKDFVARGSDDVSMPAENHFVSPEAMKHLLLASCDGPAADLSVTTTTSTGSTISTKTSALGPKMMFPHPMLYRTTTA